MRPYAIETVFIFAAGMCVGAWLMEHTKAKQFPAESTNPEPEKKKGVMVSMEDGKIIIDPSRRKRWFRK